MNIATQPIISSAVDPDGILIGGTPNFFLVTLVHYKRSCDTIKCLIWDFYFPIE